MLEKEQAFQGYTRLSDKIFLFEPHQQEIDELQTPTSTTEPTTIIIFAWGDGLPKHVAKYADGYHDLYPNSRIIVVLCTLIESMYQSISRHSRAMQPVIDATFLTKDKKSNTELDHILIQIMSNSGAVSFLATLLAYKNFRISMGNTDPEPLPHTLLVCDSVPGSFSFWPNLARWSRALALVSVSWVPLPAILLQSLWATFLVTTEVFFWVSGWKEDQVGRILAEGIRDPKVMSTRVPRLYLYSKGDELVSWEDVEEHVAVARGRGYKCFVERFEESPHVGHMRRYPERYWGAIKRAWESSVEEERKY